MTGAYVGTPDIWPALAGAVALAFLSLYSWRRRRVPAALPLAAGALFGTLWLLGVTLEVSAVAPATKIAWHKFQAAWQLPSATAMTCFALAYANPGRWSTPRILTPLALPPVLLMVMIATNNAQFMWRRLEVAPDGLIVRYFAVSGMIMVVYGVGLVLVDIAAFLWLFIRSPEHRWPAALLLVGDITSRGLYGLYQLDATAAPSLTMHDSFVAALFANWIMVAIALFGFRIFDPLPAARRTAVEQMHDGVVVFDTERRIVRANPAALAILSISTAHARGKTLTELQPDFPDISALLAGDLTESKPAEITLGTEPDARRYVFEFSALDDFRGLLIGYLLLLHDVTERRKAQAQIMQQQTALAALREREQIARELHDGLSQVLGFIKMQAQAARDLLAQERKAEADSYLERLVSVTQEVHTDLREYIFEASAHPPHELGFSASLRQHLDRFSQNHPILTELTIPTELTDECFEPTVAAQLLRIIQEALNNARKHAHASEVRICLADRGRMAEIIITDNGQGFDPLQAAGNGFGLRFMRERADEVGGSIEVRSAPGRGAQVIIEVPIRRESILNETREGGS